MCSIEPLIIEEEEHPLKSYCIVALATLSKFFVVMIRPRLKVIKFHPLQGPPDSLPLISWQMVLIQSADSTRVIDPVLAAARGTNVYFHQVNCKLQIVNNKTHKSPERERMSKFLSSFYRYAFNRAKSHCYFYGTSIWAIVCWPSIGWGPKR